MHGQPLCCLKLDYSSSAVRRRLAMVRFQTIATPGARGKVASLVVLASAIVSYALAPLLVALITDHVLHDNGKNRFERGGSADRTGVDSDLRLHCRTQAVTPDRGSCLL